MTDVGRNEPCSCGSGLKYKRCCLRRRGDVAPDALAAERVWERMQSWALARFGDELGAAVKQHLARRGVGDETHPANDEDLALALGWLLIDRELSTGGTPARLYAALPELAADDRKVADRIAASHLGLYRVTAAEPGVSIDLESVLTGEPVCVASPSVSREAVRWHVLLCRVMRGGPMASLWGAAGFYEPSEEDELLAELGRVAAANDLGQAVDGLAAALRVGAGDLVCFVPPSRSAERLAYTLEGDLVVIAEANWRLRDPRAVFDALNRVSELVFDEETVDGITFDWLGSRRALLARRRELPLGAIVLESGPMAIGDDGTPELEDVTSLGTFTLRGDRLDFFGMSEARVAAAEALVVRHVGSLAGRPRRRVRAIDVAGADARGQRDPAPRCAEESVVPDARVRELTYRRWIDDPDERLGGSSPREAVAHREYHAELERVIRCFEHHSARERPDGRPGPEVAWLRAELGLDSGGRLAA